MNEHQIENEIKTYTELAKTDKNIDVASLMINALNRSAAGDNLLTDKQRRLAYFVSVGLPPFGLIYVVRFLYSGKDDGPRTAWICLGLTVSAFVLMLILTNVLLSGSGVDTAQLQQLSPQDIKEYQDLLK